MKQGKPDFFHSEDDWAAVPVPGSGTMMLLPPDWMRAGDGSPGEGTDGASAGEGAGSAQQVACPWCGFFTAQDAVCDRCGSPLPSTRSTFWSLLDAAS
jgi:hypothetical protein